MEKPEDIIYLKQFVKQHPDNKMGWYLLGKHYLQAGKESKANYCFIQAGDIYEAFEQETHPLAEQQLQELKDWNQQQKKKRLVWKIALAAIPLLLIALLLPFNPLWHKEPKDDGPALPGQNTPGLGVVFVPQKEGGPVGYAMNAIVAAGGAAPKQSLAIRLEEKEGWRQWNGHSRFLMSATKEGASSRLALSMLDRDTCICEPGDTSSIKKLFGEWREAQEMHWTLASAIHQYNRLYGKWPQKLEDLIRPYPHNVLSGEGEGMKEWFPYVLAKLKEKQGENGKQEQDGDDEGSGSKEAQRGRGIGTNGIFQQDWSKPLEIVIDVSNYRLAVIQDKMVIRSYKVGLGGERTPEGNFYISEKVRDPNGTDDGMFGSRGMTLSNTLYAIHGTDDPDSIGKDKSLGCIRMKKADVEELFDMVPLGTAVKIKNGTLPSDAKPSADRFKLEPRQNETNPAKVYQWLT